MRADKAALRTCLGCSKVGPREALVRLVSSGGALVIDAGAVMPGRGAYLCPDESCARKALARKGAFARAFKKETTAPPEALFMAEYARLINGRKKQ